MYSAMETGKLCDSMSSTGIGVVRYKRDLPPSHYLFKVNSFSLLLKTKVETYESDVFEAGGYKWRLCLYPNGNEKSNGACNISLYLRIEETDKLPHRWEVNVELKLFIFDQINNKYLVVQDANGIRRFHEMKTEWGFSQLLSLETFNDPSNGYLVDDSCVFGAEVFVIHPSCKWESLSMVKKPEISGSTKWKIENFSQLDDKTIYSKPFTAGGRSWRIQVDPKGYGEAKGDSLSVYLQLIDGKKLPSKKKIWAEFKLRVLDQRHDKHVERTFSHWFTSSSNIWGRAKFMPLGDLHEVSKGFVMNDTLIVEAEILVVSVSKVIS